MKKTISDVVSFPNGCETVRFTACFVSMIMRAEGISNEKHEDLYQLYTAVTGFGFMQMDLSNDEHMSRDWNQTCNILLREIDWYIGFTMDYAGYDFEELIFPSGIKKDEAFNKIKASIDKDIPILALFGRTYGWVLVTGYDGDGVLYGLDGSQGYWGKPYEKPAGYDETGLFIMPDWYEKAGHAFILGDKKESSVTMQDVFKHGIKIMETLKEKNYLRNSVNFMRNDSNFESLTDEELIKMRDRISCWIGQLIDQRAMLGYAVEPLREGTELNKETLCLNRIHELFCETHDVLWVPWKGIGEFMEGDRLEWAKGLKNKAIRNMIADCFELVCNNDDKILDYLKQGF